MIDSEKVAQSFGRCVFKGDVIERFYDIFIDSHPDIKPRFSDDEVLQRAIDFIADGHEG